ncbi:MAG: hypothetical protein ACAH83_17965 [Alphaproteobacteria bacterium]
MADPDQKEAQKSSFLGGLVDKITGAGSKFVDGMVAKGKEGMEKTLAEDREKRGITEAQQKEEQARAWRNNSIYKGANKM